MNLVDRVKKILLSPKGEWEVIKGESHTVKGLFTNYAVILAAIPAVAGFLGFTFLGISYGYGSYTLPYSTSLSWAVLSYILSLAGAYAIGFVIDFLAPNFSSTKNLVESMKVAVFASTASWVGGIFQLIPSLSILASIAGIYSLVLLYMGLQKIKDVPQEKMVIYFIAILVVSIIVFAVTGAIVSAVVFSGAMIM